MTEGCSEAIAVIYTDGAAEPNPGPGSYAAIVEYLGVATEHSGSYVKTTNNRMEIMAAIVGLESLPQGVRAHVVTDSQYLSNGATSWIHKWRRTGWKVRGNKPVLNRDLWERLAAAAEAHSATWEWVRGHSGHRQNERCDALAAEALFKPRVYDVGYMNTTEATPRLI